MAKTKLDELQQKIDELQKERDALLERERDEAIDQINAMVKTYGIEPGDIDFAVRPVRKVSTRLGSKVAAKYKFGNETWSGRGRKPKWVEEHLAKGGKLDDLLV